MQRCVILSCLVPVVFAVACGREAPPPSFPQASADVYLQPDTEDIAGRIPRNATLAGLMYAHLGPDQAADAVRLISASFDPRKLRADQPYSLTRTSAGALRAFHYEIDLDQYLRVAPASYDAPADLRAEVITYAREEATTAAAGPPRTWPC